MMTAKIAENKKLDENKIILGLSGGVDSTVAALILQRQGYEVIGLYFNVQNDNCLNYEENILQGRMRAERAAEQLGIELVYRDVSDRFNKIVIDNFCAEYMKGRTPNPCIICNPEVKFRTLIDVADEYGAKYIATGHYAGTYMNADDETWYITKGANEKKDQSYMLYRLNQETISRLIMPLSSYEDKEDIRRIARNAGVSNAENKDSQEICFIDSSDNYLDFMKRRGCEMCEGDFVDLNGNVLGKSKSICAYTIGQRKNLGIALGYPAFVTNIDSKKNAVQLSSGKGLFSKTAKCTGSILRKQADEVTAKIRYAAKPAKARIACVDNDKITVEFEEPQRAITPGQSLVLYDGNLVIGGGFIII